MKGLYRKKRKARTTRKIVKILRSFSPEELASFMAELERATTR